MRYPFISCVILSGLCLLGTPTNAETSGGMGLNDFLNTVGDAKTVVVNDEGASSGLPAITSDVEAGNKYAGSDYKNFFLAQPVIRGTITFSDATKNYERFAWFQQILSEHGCQTLSVNKTESKSGWWIFGKKTLSVSVNIEGRTFVVTAVKGHYGGSASDTGTIPSLTTDSAFQNILTKEKETQAAEEQILKYAFEIDDLIVARSKLGFFSSSKKGDIDRRMSELKDRLIPATKDQVNTNTDTIHRDLFDLARQANQKGDYNRTIALLEVSGVQNDETRWLLASAYRGLGDYDKAIEQYSVLAKTPAMAEKAWLGIAECQHLQGKPVDTLASLFKVLEDFHNGVEENDALSKIDQWELIKANAGDPSVPKKVSDIYLTKAVVENGSAHSQAVVDYKKAVEILANDGNKAEASKNILAEASKAQMTNSQELDRAKEAAGQRFVLERDQAARKLVDCQTKYNLAVANSGEDYRRELSDKYNELREAEDDLDYLEDNPPVGVDPESDEWEKYESRIDSLDARVDKLDSEYTWLLYHQTEYVKDHTTSENRALQDAKTVSQMYDLSRKDAYINNDAVVQKFAQLTKESELNYQMLTQLAKEVGY